MFYNLKKYWIYQQKKNIYNSPFLVLTTHLIVFLHRVLHPTFLKKKLYLLVVLLYTAENQSERICLSPPFFFVTITIQVNPEKYTHRHVVGLVETGKPNPIST